jgi:aminoglycoside phosphotransferase (APT) family kinase protein
VAKHALRVCYSNGMNPDTKATREHIQAVCAKHSIPYHSHSRITKGFSHEVHRLNDDLVLKFYNAPSSRKFQTEQALLSSDLSFPKPRLIASGKADEQIDRDYVVMSYVPGVSLGSCWHKATNQQREALIKSMCEALIQINQIDPKELGLDTHEPWDLMVRKRGDASVMQLWEKRIIDLPTAMGTLEALANRSTLLKDSRLHTVHWDIQFDNFIVSKDFKLQALIDLENVEVAALDYPLFVVYKMTQEPEKFLQEDEEKHADVADYVHLVEWYKSYYPAMFAFDNLEQRVKLYTLLDTLHLLHEWSHVTELHTKLATLIAG